MAWPFSSFYCSQEKELVRETGALHLPRISCMLGDSEAISAKRDEEMKTIAKIACCCFDGSDDHHYGGGCFLSSTQF